MIKAIMYYESSFRTDAVNSRTKCTGLMQIHEISLKHFNNVSGYTWTMDDMKNPHKNIIVGIWILGKKIEKADCDIELALKYYSHYAKNYHKNVIKKCIEYQMENIRIK